MTVKTLFNLKNEIEKIAALKIHSHDIATSENNGFLSKEDKAKLDGIANNANNFSLSIDTELDSTSTNPLTNKVITEKYNELVDQTITIKKTIDPTSETEAVCGKAVADYVTTTKNNIQTGTIKNPKSTGTSTSLNENLSNGIYFIKESIIISNGRESIDVKGGYLTVKKTDNIQTQNIITPNGIEYSRWRQVNNTTWNDWKIYYMPYRQYTKGFTPNTDVYNFQIMENTAGFTILWNQGTSQDKNYFVTSSVANQWKHVVYFNEPLPIDGAFVFGNLGGEMDIMITGGHQDGFYNKKFASGVYIRSPKGSNRIQGIHEAYFVPRNN